MAGLHECPDEVLLRIASSFEARELCCLSSTCKHLRRALSTASITFVDLMVFKGEDKRHMRGAEYVINNAIRTTSLELYTASCFGDVRPDFARLKSLTLAQPYACRVLQVLPQGLTKLVVQAGSDTFEQQDLEAIFMLRHLEFLEVDLMDKRTVMPCPIQMTLDRGFAGNMINLCHLNLVAAYLDIHPGICLPHLISLSLFLILYDRKLLDCAQVAPKLRHLSIRVCRDLAITTLPKCTVVLDLNGDIEPDLRNFKDLKILLLDELYAWADPQCVLLPPALVTLGVRPGKKRHQLDASQCTNTLEVVNSQGGLEGLEFVGQQPGLVESSQDFASWRKDILESCGCYTEPFKHRGQEILPFWCNDKSDDATPDE